MSRPGQFQPALKTSIENKWSASAPVLVDVQFRPLVRVADLERALDNSLPPLHPAPAGSLEEQAQGAG
jgi:hypothetical protein